MVYFWITPPRMLWKMLSSSRHMPWERNVMPDSQLAPQRSKVMLNEPSDGIRVAEDDELVVHVRRDFDLGVLGRAEDADQLDARLLEVQVVGAVGQRHLAPVDLDLDEHAVGRRVEQVVDEVGVVDAVHAHLDRVHAVGLRPALADHGVDLVVDVALGMVGMVGLALGELGRQVERVEVVVDPVDVALEHGGVGLDRAPGVGGGVVVAERAALVQVVVEVVAVHPDVFVLRRDGALAEVNDIGELDRGDAAEAAWGRDARRSRA